VSFTRLSEEEQVARLEGLARRALAAWDAGDADLDLIKYRENTVFRVTRPDGRRHVLRVHRPRYRSDPEIRSEAAWMGALAEAGIPTPAHLPTRTGDVLAWAEAPGVPEARQCDLLAWVDGAPLGTLEGGVALDAEGLHRTYATVGGIAAALHAHGESWPKPSDFARPCWDLESLVGDQPTFGRFEDLAVLTDDQRRTLLRARERVRAELLRLGPPALLIHGDLIPDNLLAGSGGVRVIDFDDCGWSWFGFELATSLFPLLVSGGFDAGLAAYLQGYRARRPVPERELAQLPALLVARALSYLGWPVGRPEIHSQSAAAPFFAKAISELAELYLAGAL
jgi:Ser/Thr protein kinase RdoA (MazF antagonist)